MSEYKSMSPEDIEGILSQFLVNSWSYSKLSTFARNEKAFEMQYIFGCDSRRSSTTIAGQAYHSALEMYFKGKKEGKTWQLPDLEIIAFNEIDEVPANYWKIQKTTPTILDCKNKATATVTALLKNFYGELSTYEDQIKEIIAVEVKGSEFITINGVDIPLPCNYRIDLIVRTIDDKVVIIDHKSKSTYTSEDEIGLTTGLQAITYIKCCESATGQHIDEVWFVENKYSANKNKDPQLFAFKIALTDDTRRLYEAMLYEPLRKLISALNDPD